jgi:2-polyprenyl-3-methyl-5-hydroxy-6-metoxy-1,4-benzoquinol methylase
LSAEFYYAQPRPEILRLVPAGAREVLDIGCGAGALGAQLRRERPGISVRGIELVPEQAAQARLVLDDAVAMSEDGPFPAEWPAPDCLVFADVLEHLVDPWTALKTWRSRARAGAWAVVSLPNIGHVSTITGLLKGRWQYEDHGLLDRTHLRFFTRETGRSLIEQAGFAIERMDRTLFVPESLPGKAVWNAWARSAWRREQRDAPFSRAASSILDLLTFQFLFVARSLP